MKNANAIKPRMPDIATRRAPAAEGARAPGMTAGGSGRGHATPGRLAPADPTQTGGAQPHQVVRAGEHTPPRSEDDLIAQEIPVALEYNGISHATLLATPCDLEDLAYGFSYTEGIIRSASDVYDMNVVEAPQGMIIQISIANACLNQLKLRRRALAGRTGCGLCGIESLDEVRRNLAALPSRPGQISGQGISRAMRQLRALQPLHLATGATHAAGWASAVGQVLHVREDVGRHNALDKLIGHLLRHAIATDAGIAAISSRASFEMVQKAASAGISAVAAVSAPTTYAIQLATELNVLLAGFARDNRFNLYAHPEFLGNNGGLN